MSSVQQWMREKMSSRIRTVVFLAGIIVLNFSAVDVFAFQCADVTEIPSAECEALQDLYNSTNGVNWSDKTGWLANNTPCDWFGVTCRNGQVVYLNLSNNGLQGNIPETIGNFSTLEYLNLDGNELVGSIPTGIGQLTVLDQLRLKDNQLTTIPDSIGQCAALTFLDLKENKISVIPSQLGALSNLTYLELSSNQLTSTSFPAEFSHLTALETLGLFENSLTSLPASISDLTNLKGINLGWNKPLESLAGIGKLTGLENLYLHSTELAELPEEIANLTNLKVLWLTGNLFTQFPSVVTQFTGLETLLLTYNPQMTGELPLSLVNLTKMKDFKFDGTELCVPQNAGFQAWLAGITTVVSSGKECSAPSNMSDIEKSVRIMRMLTGHEETCTDLDVDGDGKVELKDSMLALLLSDKNHLSLYTNPTDPQILKLKTKNGATAEYFAEKDETGKPTHLTHIYVNNPDGTETKVIMDSQGRPARLLNEDGSEVRVTWLNDTSIEVTILIPGEETPPPTVIDLQNQAASLSAQYKSSLNNAQTVESSELPFNTVEYSTIPSSFSVDTFVKQCGTPRNDAIVEMRVKDGEHIDTFPTKFKGNGQYRARIPTQKTGAGATFEEICSNTETVLGIACDASPAFAASALHWCVYSNVAYFECVAAAEAAVTSYAFYCNTVGYSPSPGAPSWAGEFCTDGGIDNFVERAIDIFAEGIYLSPLITVEGIRYPMAYKETSALGTNIPPFEKQIDRDYVVSTEVSPKFGTAPLKVQLSLSPSIAWAFPDTGFTWYYSSDGQNIKEVKGRETSILLTQPGEYSVRMRFVDEYNCDGLSEVTKIIVDCDPEKDEECKKDCKLNPNIDCPDDPDEPDDPNDPNDPNDPDNPNDPNRPDNPNNGASSGDPHLYTFDGLKYDFQAVGEFDYLQSTQDPTEMTIQMRQGPWGDSKHIAGNTAVAMSVGGDIVEINVENTPRLSINNAPVTMADKEVRQLNNGCKIYAETQRRYWVIWKDNSMAEVRTYNSHLDISVSLPDNRKGLVKGLMGNNDGDKTNDLQTRDGSKTFDIATRLTKDELYNQFGNSWRITQAESLFTYATGEDTATYTDLNFPYELVKASDLSETVRANAEQTCRDAGITDPILLEDCILDVGLTGDATFAENMTDLTPPEQSITVTDGWLLYEDAQKTEGEQTVHITADERWQTGMAIREGALNLDGDFEKTFIIYMGSSVLGGDGMIFLMLPEIPPADTSLNSGGNLGFSSACNGKPCLGVEIDTYHNSYDPSAVHIALIRNGSVDHNSTENQTLPSVPLAFKIEDDTTHSLTISWNKETQILSVALDGSTLITHEGLDLKTLLGTSVATYGFVGATGTATSEQYFYPVISF